MVEDTSAITQSMPYSNFTLERAINQFDLQLTEADFVPDVPRVVPSAALSTMLEGMTLGITPGSEKARSEFIIAPVLLEVWNLLERQISIFSGVEFTVDPSQDLTGICDFLISRSPIQSIVEAPVVVIIEAKKGDINAGLGQCLAEMVAAQHFNARKPRPITTIYGTVTTGTNWRFLQIESTQVTIGRQEYSLFPIEHLLGILTWLLRH
jgi:hypothetical protein